MSSWPLGSKAFERSIGVWTGGVARPPSALESTERDPPQSQKSAVTKTKPMFLASDGGKQWMRGSFIISAIPLLFVSFFIASLLCLYWANFCRLFQRTVCRGNENNCFSKGRISVTQRESYFKTFSTVWKNYCKRVNSKATFELNSLWTWRCLICRRKGRQMDKVGNGFHHPSYFLYKLFTLLWALAPFHQALRKLF